MSLRQITESEYEKEVANFPGVVLLNFSASWCGPCKMLTPILEELERNLNEGVKILKVDVDQDPKLAEKFGVLNIPFVAFLKDGKLVSSIVGLRDKQAFESAIKELG